MKTPKCIFGIFFLCSFFLPMAQGNFALEISSVTFLQKDKKIAWKVQGQTTYPKGTLFQIAFAKNSPVFIRTIFANSFMVEGKNWEFVLGDFDKEIPPGKYSITVFFSPQFQESKVESSFQKSKYDFFWQEERHPETFRSQRKKIKVVYSQIQELYQIMLRDRESAKKMAMPAIWEAGNLQRGKQLESLREKKEKYFSEYLVPFFHFPFWDMYALLNLLEDIEEETFPYLQGKEESRLPELQQRFCKRFEEAKISFAYETLKIADDMSVLLEEEWGDLYASIQNKRSFSPIEKNPDELRTLAMYLHKIKEIRQKFLAPGLSSQAPEFFWEVSRQMQEIEEQNLSLPYLDLFYELTQSVLIEWIKTFYPDFGSLAKWPKQDFGAIWEKIAENYSKKDLFLELLLLDSKYIETKGLFFQQICAKKSLEEEEEEILRDCTTEAIKKQQSNRYFIAFSQDQGIRTYFQTYDFLCVSFIHICYLVSFSDKNAQKEISLFLEKVKKFQKNLEQEKQ